MRQIFEERRKKVELFKSLRLKKIKPTNQTHKSNKQYRDCMECEEKIQLEDLKKNDYVCPNCQHHFRMRAVERLELIVDKGTFKEVSKNKKSNNVLNMPGYDDKLEVAKRKTQLNEAVITGTGRIEGYPFAIAIMDSYFFMGSMGVVVGDKITALIEIATKKKLPLVIFSASGGARMQEGILSLMQMAKTSGAIGRHHQAGLLYVSVLTHPTTGGVSASFAMLGDITLAEPKALIGFAGPRVIKQTINQVLPEGFQQAEFLEERGFVDQVIARKELKHSLATIAKIHGGVPK